MYYKMFTNESKEYMEYADYTFEEHFKGKNVPSYMPRAVIREYLIGRYAYNTYKKINGMIWNHDFFNYVIFNTKITHDFGSISFFTCTPPRNHMLMNTEKIIAPLKFLRKRCKEKRCHLIGCNDWSG